MKRNNYIYKSFIILILLNTFVLAEEKKGLRLEDCFSLAKANYDKIKIQKEKMFQVLEDINQARAKGLPQVRFKGLNSHYGVFNENNRDGTQSYIYLNQRLFEGFRRKNEISALKTLYESERLKEIEIIRNLYLQVANSFFQIVKIDADKKNLYEMQNLIENRILELKNRERLGKSRKSEVLSVESRLLTIKAKIQEIDNERTIKLESLGALLGNINNFDIVDSQSFDYNLKNLKDIGKIEEDIDSIPIILVLKKEIEYQRILLTNTKNMRYPSIYFDSSLYLYRGGIFENRDWDINISFDMPIYLGGLIDSNVKQMYSKIRTLEYELSLLRLSIIQEIRLIYNNLISSIEQVKLLEESMKKIEQSYQIQLDEYRLGLVNNLDVLTTLSSLLEIKQNLDKLRIDVRLNQVLLDIETGVYLKNDTF